MNNLSTKAQNLIEERNQLMVRFNEITGALKILDELAQAETEQETENETTTEEES